MAGSARLGAPVVVLALVAMPSVARAQAWLPADGEGWLTLTYQRLVADHHLDRNGQPTNPGRIANNTVLLGIDYGMSDRLAFDARLAWTANSYDGPDRLHGPLDTGSYHGALQDARVTLRYRIRSAAALHVVPFAGVILPTHAYETRGHSAPGRRLRAAQFGVGVGRDLRPILRNAYAQAQYAFAFVERVAGMSIDRSNIDVEVGYLLSPAVTLTAAGALQRTHGGLESPFRKDDEHYAFHDRIARANHFLFSSGATLSLSPAVDLYATIVWTVAGQNTHAAKGMATGIAWTFGPRLTLAQRGRGSVDPAGGGTRNVTTTDPRRIWSPSPSR